MAKSVYDLVREKYGVRFTALINPVVAQVGTSDLIIARNNPNRFLLTVIQLGSGNLFMAPQRPATLTAGIRLTPSGGNFHTLMEEDAILPTLEWHAIASASGQDIFVLELVVID